MGMLAAGLTLFLVTSLGNSSSVPSNEMFGNASIATVPAPAPTTVSEESILLEQLLENLPTSIALSSILYLPEHCQRHIVLRNKLPWFWGVRHLFPFVVVHDAVEVHVLKLGCC